MDPRFFQDAGAAIGGNAHLYLPVHPLLRRYIAHYTVTGPFGAPLPDRLTLIPDAAGCVVCGFGPGGWTARLWGPTTRAVQVAGGPLWAQPVRVFIEFLPGGAHCLTGLSLEGMADGQWDLGLVLPGLSRELTRLLERIDSARALRAGLDALFLPRLPDSPPETPLAVLEKLRKRDGALSVGLLSAETFYSPRHLGRIVAPVLGIGVKSYGRLLRINRALSLLGQYGGRMAELAQALGYCDQSHFIHDFKAVCGVTPTAYGKNLSDFYKEPFKF